MANRRTSARLGKTVYAASPVRFMDRTLTGDAAYQI
jgi:hypothetical protein